MSEQENKLQDHLNVIFIHEEYYNESDKDNKIILPEYIVKDMLAQGLDPLNRDDIQSYWTSKGISE